MRRNSNNSVISASCSAGNDEASFPRELRGKLLEQTCVSSREAWVSERFVATTGAWTQAALSKNLVVMRLGTIELQQKRNI